MKNKIFFLFFTALIFATVFSPFISYGMQKDQLPDITLDLKDVDILDVFKIISMHSGINIVAGQDIKAKVTIFLKDVNTWDAFEVVLAVNNFAYKEDGGIVKVMTEENYLNKYGKTFYDETVIETIRLENTKAEDVKKTLEQIKSKVGKVILDTRSNAVVIKDTPEMVARMKEIIKNTEIDLETRVFDLKYSDPEKMFEKIKTKLTQDIGSVEMDRRTGKLIVTDFPKKIDRISKMLDIFDRQSKEVVIDAKIVEVNLNNEYKDGINWDRLFGKLSVGANIKKGGLVYFADLEGNGFSLLLDAFKDMGDVKVISRPEVSAFNHREAKIKITERCPYVITNVTDVGEYSEEVAESVTFLDIGTQLSVVPDISPDGMITMKIIPKISTASEFYTYDFVQGKNDTIKRSVPIEEVSRAETTITVQDGRTVIIGGLMKQHNKADIEKIPALGDIPILGKIFQRKTIKPSVIGLTIFLTPRIVTGRKDADIKKEDVSYRNSMEYSSKEPTLSWLKKGKKNAYTDYYLTLSSMISEYITSNYVPSSRGGRVNMILNLYNNGKLVEDPYIIKADFPEAAESAFALIKKTKYFPPFPKEIDKEKEKFKISINLPSYEGITDTGKREVFSDKEYLIQKQKAKDIEEEIVESKQAEIDSIKDKETKEDMTIPKTQEDISDVTEEGQQEEKFQKEELVLDEKSDNELLYKELNMLLQKFSSEVKESEPEIIQETEEPYYKEEKKQIVTDEDNVLQKEFYKKLEEELEKATQENDSKESLYKEMQSALEKMLESKESESGIMQKTEEPYHKEDTLNKEEDVSTAKSKIHEEKQKLSKQEIFDIEKEIIKSREEQYHKKDTVISKEKSESSMDLNLEDMAYSEYYLTLSELISNYIVRNYVSVEGGKAQIQFVLSEDGKLLGEPNVLTSENDQLKILLTRAVNELSPFPPFPQGIKRNQEKFLILINIPDTEETVFESDSNQFENVFFNGYGMSYENEKDGLETESELLSESENLLSNYSNYRKTINRKILNAAKGFDGKNGVVKIQFTINRLGELVKEPVIISNTGSKELEDLTVKTLKSVCPFDPMPESVLENNVNFIVSIVYE